MWLTYIEWVMGFNESTLGMMGSLSLAPNSSQNPVSLNGAGLSADASGNMYIFGGTAAAQAPFSNAFLKLSTSTAIGVAGYSNISNASSASTSAPQPALTGALILPDITDASGNTLHLAVGAGADGNIYIVNRDSLTAAGLKFTSVYQEITGALSWNGVNSLPAYFGNTVYFGSAEDAIKAFSITAGLLSTSPVGQTTDVFGSTGANPSVSANLTTGAILWAVDNSGSGPILRAFDATNLSQELYNSAQASTGRDSLGATGNFVFPVIANGKVYIATQNGVVVFGLLQ
jgi:hypothetical protein